MARRLDSVSWMNGQEGERVMHTFGYKFRSAARLVVNLRSFVISGCETIRRGREMGYQIVDVDPKDLRFTQTSIGSKFQSPYRHIFVERARENIEKGLMKSDEFPLVEVYKDEQGIMWSKDNRRLWVFRKAGLTSVSVKLSDSAFSRMPPAGPEREEMAAHDYFPVVRGGVHQVGITVHDYCADDDGSFIIVRQLRSMQL